MNEYRKQQLRAAALIDQGATAEQVAVVYGWIRGEPELPAQTGYNQTLTAPRKCGIIKAIKRQIRRKTKNYRRAKTMTIKINLTQDAYINNGEYRLHTDSGKPSTWMLCDWYEAAATDNDGNEYRVIWAIRDDWDAESGDESDACDWDNPTEIIRLDTGDNVTSRAKIEW